MDQSDDWHRTAIIIIWGPGGGNFIPLGYNYTYDYHKPNLLVTSDSANIKVLDLNNSNTLTNVASYSDSRTLITFSQAGGRTIPNSNSANQILGAAARLFRLAAQAK